MLAKDIASLIEEIAPLNYQEHYDNAGIQVGCLDREITGCLVCLDVTEEVVEEAIALGYNMILSHHPIIFHALKHLSGETHTERVVEKAIRNNLILYAAHTNLDKAPQGVNYYLANLLGLRNVQTLAPEPALGKGVGLGVIGELETETSIFDFLRMVKEKLGIECLRHTACVDHKIRTAALCGGGGSDLYRRAVLLGADIYLTGEVKFPLFYEGNDNFVIADFGHYESEQIVRNLFLGIIRNKFPNFAIQVAQASRNPIKYL